MEKLITEQTKTKKIGGLTFCHKKSKNSLFQKRNTMIQKIFSILVNCFAHIFWQRIFERKGKRELIDGILKLEMNFEILTREK